MMPCLIVIISLGAWAMTSGHKALLRPPSIMAGVVKNMKGSGGTVLGLSTQTPGHTTSINQAKKSTTSAKTPTPLGNNTSLTPKQLVTGHTSVQVASSSTTVPAGHLIMSPDEIVMGNVYSPSPTLYMSNGLEITEPAIFKTSELDVDWYNTTGHSAAGPYYPNWIPMIQRMHGDDGTDGTTSFTATVQDRAGNSYSTTFKVIWMAARNLGISAGSITKQTVGDNVVFTGQVLFSPTANVGHPSIHITDNGFYNFGKDPCNVSETDTTIVYTGQSSYDVSCVISSDNLANYPNGFDIYVDATAGWAPQTPEMFTTKFHTD
jgi:hypothetical protein